MLVTPGKSKLLIESFMLTDTEVAVQDFELFLVLLVSGTL